MSSTKENSKSKYGVKSYLHHFYEDCSGIGLCETEQQAYETSKLWKRGSWIACVTIIILGLCIFTAGLVLLLYGGLQSPATRKTEISVCLFSVGGVIIVISITFACMEIMNRKQERLEQLHFQEQCKVGMVIQRHQDLEHSSMSLSTSSTPSNDFPVSLCEISAVQPLLEDSLGTQSIDDLENSTFDHASLTSPQ